MRVFTLSLLELAALHARTDMEGLLIVTRANWDDFHIPYYYATSDTVHRVFELLNKMTVNEFAVRMEAFCIAGMHGESTNLHMHSRRSCKLGLTKNHRERIMDLKKKCRELILQKLREYTIRNVFFPNY